VVVARARVKTLRLILRFGEVHIEERSFVAPLLWMTDKSAWTREIDGDDWTDRGGMVLNRIRTRANLLPRALKKL
jgi:hypothetical protein